jgi:hypothetical protein
LKLQELLENFYQRTANSPDPRSAIGSVSSALAATTTTTATSSAPAVTGKRAVSTDGAGAPQPQLRAWATKVDSAVNSVTVANSSGSLSTAQAGGEKHSRNSVKGSSLNHQHHHAQQQQGIGLSQLSAALGRTPIREQNLGREICLIVLEVIVEWIKDFKDEMATRQSIFFGQVLTVLITALKTNQTVQILDILFTHLAILLADFKRCVYDLNSLIGS